MAEINDWNIVDNSNNAAVPDGWPENMNYSEVNDTGRAVQGKLKRFFVDIGGSLAAGGVADAYTLTLSASYTAYFDGLYFVCSIPITNTGAATLNVNALGVKAIIDREGNALTAGALVADTIYPFHYDGVNLRVLTPTNSLSGSLTVSGTVTASSFVGPLTGNADTATSVSTITGLAPDTATTQAAQPNVTSVGTLTGFTSTGIDDNATSIALTIDSSQGSTFTGDIILSSGKGITFPSAFSDNTDANTLDDYEEGSWTPVIEGQTTAGVGTYTTQIGTYTKIGKVVIIGMTVNWTAHTGTGNLILTGLPFTIRNDNGNKGPMSARANNLTLNASEFIVIDPLINSTSLQIHQSALGTVTSVSGVAMDTSAALYIQGSYRTDG